MRRVPLPACNLSVLYRHGGRRFWGHDPAGDFSVNINALGPPAAVLRAVRRGSKEIDRYPDPHCRRLSRALANLHGLEPRQVIVSNGANDVIYAVARALGPRCVAIVEPTYTEYLRASRLVGADSNHWVPEEDLRDLRPFDPAPADLVWLCNPNNPTGQLWRPEVLRSWIAEYPRTLFVVDESFLPFVRQEPQHSLIPALGRLANLTVLRSLTKIFAFPGLRLGYAATNRALADRIRRQIVPWSVNALAQKAGLAALKDTAFLERTHDWLEPARKDFVRRLVALNPRLTPLRSEANFVLAKLTGKCSADLTRELAERGFAIRDAANFIGLDRDYVRLTVRLAEQNRGLLDALDAVLAPVSLTPQ